MPDVTFISANIEQYEVMRTILLKELREKLYTSGESKTDRAALETASKLVSDKLPAYNANKNHKICAINDGAISVGYVWYFIKSEDSNEVNTRLAFLYIHPQYRHRGYGTAAIEYLEKQLKGENRLNRLDLNLFVSNTSGYMLYEKLGYVIDRSKSTVTHIELYKKISET